MMATPLMHRFTRVSMIVGLLGAACVPDAENVVADGGGTSSGGAAADTSSGSIPPDALDTTAAGPTTADSTTAGSSTVDATDDTSSGDEGGSSTGEPPPSSPFVDACVDGVNLYRAMEGLPLLSRWTEGEACAMQVAMDDAAVGDMGEPFGSISRGRPCGQTRSQWCGTVDGVWEDPVEEIAACAERYFLGGPQDPNYQNMMDPAHTQVACGWAETSGGWFFAYHLFR